MDRNDDPRHRYAAVNARLSVAWADPAFRLEFERLSERLDALLPTTISTTQLLNHRGLPDAMWQQIEQAVDTEVEAARVRERQEGERNVAAAREHLVAFAQRWHLPQSVEVGGAFVTAAPEILVTAWHARRRTGRVLAHLAQFSWMSSISEPLVARDEPVKGVAIVIAVQSDPTAQTPQDFKELLDHVPPKMRPQVRALRRDQERRAVLHGDELAGERAQWEPDRLKRAAWFFHMLTHPSTQWSYTKISAESEHVCDLPPADNYIRNETKWFQQLLAGEALAA